MYLYHRVPTRVIGSVIRPLNQLKELDQDLYDLQKAKYKGRDDVAEQTIPPLNCGWGDVVFLTAVSPQELQRAFAEAGTTLQSRKFYQIEAKSLDPNLMTVRLYPGGRYFPRVFVPFNLHDLEEYSKVPTCTVEYYRLQHQTGQYIMTFHHIPHILYKGAIDVSDVTIVEL